MGKSVRAGRIAGMPLAVDAGLAVLASLFLLVLTFQVLPVLVPNAAISSRLVVAGFTVAAFLLSILGHELGHAFTARRYGIGVLGINLTLLGGYAKLDRQADTPKAEFLIAAAGPAVNIFLGAALTTALYFTRPTEAIAPSPTLIYAALSWLAGMNIVLAVLNLFPAAPLDGGRVLTAVLWRRLNDAEKARVISGRVGLIVGALLSVAGVYQALQQRWEGLILVVVGVFLVSGARSEIASAVIRRRLRDTTSAHVMKGELAPVSDSLTAEQLLRNVNKSTVGTAIPVVRWTADPIGYVVPQQAASLDVPQRSWTKVQDLMRPDADVARAWATEAIDSVLERQNATDDLVVVIHDPTSGSVVGTVAEAQIAPILQPPDIWGRDIATPN